MPEAMKSFCTSLIDCLEVHLMEDCQSHRKHFLSCSSEKSQIFVGLYSEQVQSQK